MPRRYMLSTLVERCQRRADKENDAHISAAEWKALVSEQYGDLFSVVAGTGLRYFETESTITADGSTSYDEPSDHYATVGVDFVADAGTDRRIMLAEIMPQEHARWSGRTGRACSYALVDDQLYLYPRPQSGTYKWLYIPQPTNLADYDDDGLVDVVTPDGEAFLIWGVAVKALAKSESDAQLAIAEREAARARLTEWAQLRAFHEPRRVVMTEPDGRFCDDADWRYR